MILYLTYNDQPSGVYWSQVTDVVAHLNGRSKATVRLVALVSGRGFFATRKAIRARCPGAVVLPMVPTMRWWRANTAVLAMVCRWLRPTGIMCRGPFATWMALRMRDRGLVQRVVFDGRGAYAAEWEEYRLIDDDALIAQFRPVEQEAVTRADHRLAVSHALVDHWRERYAYQGNDHVVVPCTLSDHHAAPGTARAPDGRVRLVYSGSTAGWQSFALLEAFLTQLLDARPEVDLLFLSRNDPHSEALAARYPGRVQVRWLDPTAVPDALAACDHGIMLREPSVTNRVASPTKFAEYLASGLRIITDPGLGDLSALVEQEQLGVLVQANGPLPKLEPVPAAERERLVRVARARFTKAAHAQAYDTLLRVLGGQVPADGKDTRKED